MKIICSFIPSLAQFLVILAVFLLIFPIVPIIQSKLLRLYCYCKKPFSCVLCLSFWLSLLIFTLLAYIFDWHFFIWGLITSSAIAYIEWYDNK